MKPQLKEYDRIVSSFVSPFKKELFEEIKDRTWIWLAGPTMGQARGWDIWENVIVQSEYVLESEKIPYPSKVTVCPAGVDTEFFKPQDNSEKDIEVGAVSRKLPFKRLDLLRKTCKPFNLHVHSPEDEFIPRRKMVELYNQMQCFVTLSSCEGGPMSLLEAAACGIPLVSTPVGYAEEISSCRKVSMNPSVEEVQEAIRAEKTNPREEILNNWSWKVLLDKWKNTINV